MNDPAFDPIARNYDSGFTHTLTGRYQRDQVYSLLHKLLTRELPEKILELNCGTGEDALWFARNGCSVLATDISENMIQVAREKAANNKLNDKINCRTCSIEEVSRLSRNGPFDLIFSNFGGLNCLPPHILQQAAKDMASLLHREGHLVLVVMSRFCWWETLYFLLKGRSKEAWRRKSEGPVIARLSEHANINTWYYSPSQLIRLFSECFSPKQIRPVGFFLPPSYLDPAFAKHSRALRVLNRLESWCPNGTLFSSGADHFIVHLRKR